MKLLVVHGAPGVGKLSVATELCSRTGFRMLHYHALGRVFGLLFGYGSPEFVEARDRFYPDVVRIAARSGLEGVVSTFIFEPTVPLDALTELWQEVADDVFFVGLTCAEDEHRRRIEMRVRGPLGGIANFQQVEESLAQGLFEFPDLPDQSIIIDTTDLDPREVATQVLAALPEQWGVAR